MAGPRVAWSVRRAGEPLSTITLLLCCTNGGGLKEMSTCERSLTRPWNRGAPWLAAGPTIDNPRQFVTVEIFVSSATDVT